MRPLYAPPQIQDAPPPSSAWWYGTTRAAATQWRSLIDFGVSEQWRGPNLLLVQTGSLNCTRRIMSFGCLVCHVHSPAESFRSYSVSSSENEGRCAAFINCLNRIVVGENTTMTSKVAPQPLMENDEDLSGTPRLIRSHAVRRDLFRDWNFENSMMV
ncbi:hypothetical protein EJ110_NYTH51934 [Nymphaea thermarum]|nr:hypothetical protein EJ110_NYTH51934 [Nymphaea thermarum]